MDINDITVDNFKDHFYRDFPYAPNAVSESDCNAFDYVLDKDIEKAFSEAKISFNQNLFEGDEAVTIGYLYLSAHYLVTDLRRSNQGLESVGENQVSSRSVGSVSESYGIPEKFLKDPRFSFFVSTGYGLKYLALILPNLVGNFGAVAGASQA